jgi:hypothetical protein
VNHVLASQKQEYETYETPATTKAFRDDFARISFGLGSPMMKASFANQSSISEEGFEGKDGGE